ncbi:MAG: hypothetical protein ACUVXI_07010 [bacterium]
MGKKKGKAKPQAPEEIVPPEGVAEEPFEGMVQEEELAGLVAGEKMKKATRIASKVMKKRMEAERPEDLKVLNELKDENIVVVSGTYDRVEDVLSLAGIPFKLITPADVDRFPLKPDQILMVNCPGQIGERGIRNIQEFVRSGGYLLTTDWSLANILEKAFPGIVKYNQRPTSNDVVKIEVVDRDNPLLAMIMSDSAEPNWWLEGSSYPIQILDKEGVKVLLQSREMGKKYGETPIAIYFEVGQGRVFHITSHFYLQRAETRTARQAKGAEAYVSEELGLPEEAYADMKEEMKGVSVGEVESTYAMQQFMANIIVKKFRKSKK